MSETVISVENLYKEYKLGVISHGTLYHDMQSWWARIIGKEDPNSIISAHHSSDVEESSFLALNDVSFEVKEGEILGIIGKNGAGKSTLLKILSRITSPTKGQIEIKGRVGSLLEVGTGFHPELTGRENIYLNGAILGMKKGEINKKLDEIIDFAGIERHIDTPVKRYSSGMYVRLAFSVAAHLDPEILIVDEVLAVGDADFQKKCLGKMKDISEGQGRTVLFVSHNMGTVASLCNQAILLERGCLVLQEKSQLVVDNYQNQHKPKKIEYTTNTNTNQDMYIKNAAIFNEKGEKNGVFPHDEAIFIKVICEINQFLKGTELRMILRDSKNTIVFITDVELSSLDSCTKSFITSIMIPLYTLRPSFYSVSLALFIPHQIIIELIEDILFLSVFDNGTKYAVSEGVDYGRIFSPCKVELIKNNDEADDSYTEIEYK